MNNRYLQNTETFSFLQPQPAQLTVSLSCVLYLQSSLDFVDPRISEEQKRSNVALCLHELQLYAIDHWTDHLLALVQSPGFQVSGYELEPLLQGLEQLNELHEKVAALQSSGTRNKIRLDATERVHRWQSLNISHAARSLLDSVLAHGETASLDDRLPNVLHCERLVLQCSNILNTEPPAAGIDEYQDPPLFIHIRDRYQAIVEGLMEIDGSNNELLSDFRARQSSGAFLCHYRNCSRAIQGFSTSELREKHEESHRSRFQCAHAPCGFFGTTFNTRDAMKRHATKYHDEENTAAIPNFLTRKSYDSHEDRSLFTLREVKKKRRTEEVSPRVVAESKNALLWTNPTYQPAREMLASNSPISSGSIIESGVEPISQVLDSRGLTPGQAALSSVLPQAYPESFRSPSSQHLRIPRTTSDIYVDSPFITPGDELLTFTDGDTDIETLSRSSDMLNLPTGTEDLNDFDEEIDMTQPVAERRLSSLSQRQSEETVAPSQFPGFSDLMRVANTEHLNARSASPATDASRLRSPFREASQFAQDGIPHDANTTTAFPPISFHIDYETLNPGEGLEDV